MTKDEFIAYVVANRLTSYDGVDVYEFICDTNFSIGQKMIIVTDLITRGHSNLLTKAAIKGLEDNDEEVISFNREWNMIFSKTKSPEEMYEKFKDEFV